ncbi:hypothetical protein JHK85_003161 [Glycine max]|uniref:Scarecrow-like protein 32 n=1 Tax=Glycine soja TaxID=3848 RepID=A0A445LIL3_GLYSO|nr:hypothetical protein JHK85_003161 [Glycine max]KAG5078944.1 hypothetical protein JHK86_003009 [Glycine max]RZC23086.1 Scarecrow-like protein 32 [Glycine soja]
MGHVYIEKLLLHCASALESNDVTLAQQVVWVLNNVASPVGDTNQRLTSWFLRALISRASRICPTAMSFKGSNTIQRRLMCATELAGNVKSRSAAPSIPTSSAARPEGEVDTSKKRRRRASKSEFIDVNENQVSVSSGLAPIVQSAYESGVGGGLVPLWHGNTAVSGPFFMFSNASNPVLP